MPVRFNKGGETHDRGDYSFRTNDYGSRDFARMRRFGGDYEPESSRTMSLVSSPLQVPMVGQRRGSTPSHRDSPSHQQTHYEADEDLDEEIRNVQELNRRHSIESNRRRMEYRNYDDYEDEPLEPLVPTYQPRLGRSSQRTTPQRYYDSPQRYPPRRQQRPQMEEFENEYDEVEQSRQQKQVRRLPEYQEERQEPRQLPQRRQKQEEELEDLYKWKRRVNRDVSPSRELGYVVPPMRKRTDPALQDEEENIRSVAGYIAKRKQFAVEDEDEMNYYKNPNYQYRILTGDLPVISNREVEESIDRSKLDKAPMFDMKLRSHMIWEKMNVKFTCTVRGHPLPRVTWYKDMVPLEPSLHSPGKFKVTSNFGLHILEICRASIEDSGTYRVSAQNRKGEISSYATLLVRRYDGGKSGIVDLKTGYNLKKPTDFPDVEGMNIPGYPRFVTRLYGKVVEEGQAMIITCEVDGKPAPEVFWTLNGRTIDETSNHYQIDFDGKQATLTVLKVFTDDEGEYCCRAFNSCGAATSKCYVRVQGVNAPPSAPSCVEVLESNRDYVMLSWKSPGYIGHFGGAPVEGYLIETAEAGSSIWRKWNTTPVKLTKTPITGLTEGKVYFFRVRTITRWDKSAPSMPSGAVAIRDAGTPRLPEELVDPASLLPPEADDISVEEEDDMQLPGTPSKITATLTPSGDVVNVNWNAPENDDCEVEGYLIEVAEVGSDEWKTVTSQPLQTTDPYPVTGLLTGKSFRFRVFAVNLSGCSEPSECSSEITIRGKILEDVKKDETEANIKDIEDLGEKTIQDCSETCDNADQCSNKSTEEIEACTKQTTDDITEQTDVVTSKDVKEVTKPEKFNKDIVKSKLPSSPVDVKGLNATREYIDVGWTPPFKTGGEDPVYYIEMKKVGTDDWKICNQAPIGLTHYPVLGVESGESYIFRVRAVTSRGTSEFSEESEPVIATDGIKPPNWWGGVQGLFRIADNNGKPCVTKNSVKVCWDTPTTDGGSAITGYFLEYRPAGGKFKPVNNKPLNQRHFIVDGLNPGQEFEFRVCACNVAGCGEWKMLPGRVLAKDPEPPSYPTDLLITAVGDETVSLKWKEPVQPGDAKFVGYILERCKEGSDIWIPCNKMPEEIRDEKYKVDGLVNGQTYFFRVRGANKVGPGAPSLMSCFVTPGEEWALVEDRQNAMLEMRRLREEEELAKRRAAEEEEKKQAFISGIEECKVEVGERAYFECVVKDPTTEVKWFLGVKQEIAIEPVGKYDIVHIGNVRSLIITNCQAADVQTITCVALYNGCTTSADCLIDGMLPVVFNSTPEDNYINKGETATFECNLTRKDAKVSWYKNGQLISEDDERYEIIVDGTQRTLIVKDVGMSDCAAYTVSGFGGSFTSHLVVDGVLPAEFESSIDGGDYGFEEEEAVFECGIIPSALYVDGMEPECAWYHNGERVEDGDDKYELIVDGNKRTLKILGLSYEDSGEVVCKCGGDERSCEIDVERPPPPPPKVPVLQKEDAAINFLQGLRSEALPGAIRLYCVLEELRDDVKIYWYRDETVLDTKGKEYNCIVDRESGLVSIVFNHPTADLDGGVYTCEFITSNSTFDTKVNFQFGDGEFDHVFKAAMKLKEDEEREKQDRLDERKRKRAELRKKREEKEKSTKIQIPQQKKKVQEPIVEVTSDGIRYDVDANGSLVLHAEVNGMDSKATVTWLKNSVKISGDRTEMNTTDNTVQLMIMAPESTDAGTYTCKIKTRTSSTEMSADVTGNVFTELLSKSEQIRSSNVTMETEESGNVTEVDSNDTTRESDDVAEVDGSDVSQAIESDDVTELGDVATVTQDSDDVSDGIAEVVAQELDDNIVTENDVTDDSENDVITAVETEDIEVPEEDDDDEEDVAVKQEKDTEEIETTDVEETIMT